MKIAFISDNFYPELSGIADSIQRSAKALTQKGHTIFFIVPRYGKKQYRVVNTHPKTHSDVIVFSGMWIARLPAIPLPGSPTQQSRIVLPLGIGIYKLWRMRPDIIHTHTPFGCGIEALIAAKLFNIPLVGTNHTVISEFMRYTHLPFGWLERAVLRYVSWYFNQCSFVSSPSRALIEEMRAFGFAKSAQQISNPLNLSAFSSVTISQADAQKQFGFSSHTLLYVGRLAPEKHIDVLLKALPEIIKKVPGAQLALAGHGKDEARLKALVQKLDIEKHVLFLGFVYPETLPLVYRAAACFVIMSTSETQSLGLIQAMAAGIPVIAANAGALSEYVTEEHGFLVPPGDYKTLARFATTILQNPERATRMGFEGKEKVRAFDTQHIIDTWETIYERAIH